MNWFIDLIKSTVFQTVISGTLVFVIAQIIQRFFLEVLQEYKALKGKIDNKLKFYANIIANPGMPDKDRIYECSKELRNLSCELEAIYKQIPFIFLRELLISSKQISDSAMRLIRLSNSLHEGGAHNALKNDDDVKIIRTNLNIPEL